MAALSSGPGRAVEVRMSQMFWRMADEGPRPCPVQMPFLQGTVQTRGPETLACIGQERMGGRSKGAIEHELIGKGLAHVCIHERHRKNAAICLPTPLLQLLPPPFSCRVTCVNGLRSGLNSLDLKKWMLGRGHMGL